MCIQLISSKQPTVRGLLPQAFGHCRQVIRQPGQILRMIYYLPTTMPWRKHFHPEFFLRLAKVIGIDQGYPAQTISISSYRYGGHQLTCELLTTGVAVRNHRVSALSSLTAA